MGMTASFQLECKFLSKTGKILGLDQFPKFRFWIKSRNMPISDLYPTPSKSIKREFPSKSFETLVLRPIWINPDFTYKILKFQCQNCTQCFQIEYSVEFPVKIIRF